MPCSRTADSAALILHNLKVRLIVLKALPMVLTRKLQSKNLANYWNILGYMFSPTDGASAAGLNQIRIPIGASDFSSDSESSAPMISFGHHLN